MTAASQFQQDSVGQLEGMVGALEAVAKGAQRAADEFKEAWLDFRFDFAEGQRIEVSSKQQQIGSIDADFLDQGANFQH